MTPPRSWSLPPEPPEDVRLRDRNGDVWVSWPRRDARPLWRREDHDQFRTSKVPFVELLTLWGPLTEVVDSE